MVLSTPFSLVPLEFVLDNPLGVSEFEPITVEGMMTFDDPGVEDETDSDYGYSLIYLDSDLEVVADLFSVVVVSVPPGDDDNDEPDWFVV